MNKYLCNRYTYTHPYNDAYEIIDRDIDSALEPNKVCDLLNKQAQQLAELKADFERLKKELGSYKSYKTDNERIRDLTNLYAEYTKINNELKQQIKEKDEQIAKYKNQLHPEAILDGLELYLKKNFKAGTMLSLNLILEIIQYNRAEFAKSFKSNVDNLNKEYGEKNNDN